MSNGVWSEEVCEGCDEVQEECEVQRRKWEKVHVCGVALKRAVVQDLPSPLALLSPQQTRRKTRDRTCEKIVQMMCEKVCACKCALACLS